MDKTMTRFLAILAALTCVASAQTYRTVTADTNNVIRTNFVLPFNSVQSIGSAAASPASAFQPANTILSNLATGDGSGLTNVSGSSNPIGSGASLTNLAASNIVGTVAVASNVTGTIAISNGGTGATTASNARVNLLPSYSGNGNRVLALNSNANDVVWVVMDGGTNGGGSGTVTSIDLSGGSTGLTFSGGPISSSGTITMAGTLAIAAGGTGATNASNAIAALLPAYTNNANRVLALNSNATAITWQVKELRAQIGSEGGVNLSTTFDSPNAIYNPNTNNVSSGFAAGRDALVTNAAGGAAVGNGTIAEGGGFAGGDTAYAYQDGAAIGYAAIATNSGGAVGKFAESRAGGFAGGSNSFASRGGGAIGLAAEDFNGGGAVGFNAQVNTSSTNTNGGGAVGSGAFAESGFAGGYLAQVYGSGVAIGKQAEAYGSTNVQLGAGQNYDEDSIQFLSAGTIDTNEWARLAELSTYPTTNISVTGTNNTNTLVFSNGILVEVQ